MSNSRLSTESENSFQSFSPTEVEFCRHLYLTAVACGGAFCHILEKASEENSTKLDDFVFNNFISFSLVVYLFKTAIKSKKFLEADAQSLWEFYKIQGLRNIYNIGKFEEISRVSKYSDHKLVSYQ